MGTDPDHSATFRRGTNYAEELGVGRLLLWSLKNTCLLHLHGSVHFDMNLTAKGLHDIVWQDDLNKQFHQNSFGRDSVQTTEGNEFPTSSIIVGYGKTEQIQRAPFRTYYSDLVRLVHESDAVLFLGFSLIDSHVSQAFTDYRDGRDRPVVFIDYAKNCDRLAGGAVDLANTGPARCNI
jgi:SIR2-like domain